MWAADNRLMRWKTREERNGSGDVQASFYGNSLSMIVFVFVEETEEWTCKSRSRRLFMCWITTRNLATVWPRINGWFSFSRQMLLGMWLFLYSLPIISSLPPISRWNSLLPRFSNARSFRFFPYRRIVFPIICVRLLHILPYFLEKLPGFGGINFNTVSTLSVFRMVARESNLQGFKLV